VGRELPPRRHGVERAEAGNVNADGAVYGREATKRMYAASLESIDWVEALVREENIDCDFSRCGHLESRANRGTLKNFDVVRND